MQASDLKPANQLVRRYGVKSVLFGGPGCGKTPSINTAPSPVMLVCEPGMLSMRNSTVPCFEAFTAPKIVEFFEWFFKSREAAKFDTFACDSFSNVAEIILEDEKLKQKHGLKAFGTMAERVMKIANDLYYMPQKHMILICKQGLFDNGRTSYIENNQVVYEPVKQKKPWFPGQDLNIRMPHLFDNVFHMGEIAIPGQASLVKALRTRETPEVFSRDRLGNLNEFEPPNFTQIFAKAMQ